MAYLPHSEKVAVVTAAAKTFEVKRTSDSKNVAAKEFRQLQPR
jgi:hypothetical protein